MTRNILFAALLALGSFASVQARCEHEGTCNDYYSDIILPCQVNCMDDCCFFLGAEALCWTTDICDLDYCADFSGDIIRDEFVGPGNLHFLNSDWTGGVRTWIGYCFRTPWDAKLVYTYYNNNTSSSKEGNILATLLHPDTDRCEAFFAKAKYNLTYQTLDFLVSRPIDLGCGTFLTDPYFGIRGLSLKQNFKVEYDGDDFETPTEAVLHSTLQGVGIIGGNDFSIYICRGFGFYGGFAGSVIANSSNGHQRQHVITSNSNIGAVELNFKECRHIVIPAIHLKAGLTWRYCFDFGKFINFSLGYEFNTYFNTPGFRRFSGGECDAVSSASRGNITLQGVVLSLELLF